MANRLMTASAPKPDRSYEAKDALHTLKRAEEIQRDKPLMRMVKQCAKSEMKSLAKVAGARKK